MTYKYEDPIKKGYTAFKIGRKDHNKIIPLRKKDIFTTIEAYYKEDEIVLYYTTSLLGKIIKFLLIPLNIILFRFANTSWSDCFSLFKEKEKGKFYTEHVFKKLKNGDLNEKFLQLEDIYYKKELKKFILWVTAKDEDGGYSSHWYGWMSGLMFNYEDACKEKEKIKQYFYDVEIVEIDGIKKEVSDSG